LSTNVAEDQGPFNTSSTHAVLVISISTMFQLMTQDTSHSQHTGMYR